MQINRLYHQVPVIHLVLLGLLALLVAALGTMVVAVPWWLAAGLVLAGEVSLAFVALRVVEHRLGDHRR